MNEAASLLKSRRQQLGQKLDEVAQKTKIPLRFIEAIENGDILALPQPPYLTLYLRRYAIYLSLSPEKIQALFRRDIPIVPPKTTPSSSHSPFTITPRLTFIATIIFATILMLAYLFYEHRQINMPPLLKVAWPAAQTLSQNSVEISGKTNPNATVIINDNPIIVGEDGSFLAKVDLKPGENDVWVEARSFTGSSKRDQRLYIFSPSPPVGK